MEVLRFDPSDKKLKFTKLPIPKVRERDRLNVHTN